MLKKLKSESWKNVTATDLSNKRKVVLYDDGYNGTTSKRPRLSYQSSRHYRRSRHTDDRKRKYRGHSFSKGSNSISLQDESSSSQIKHTQPSMELNNKEEGHSIAKEDFRQTIASVQPQIQSTITNTEPPFIEHQNRRLRRPSIANKGTQRQILTFQSNVQSTCTIVDPSIAKRKLRRPKESPQPITGVIQPTVESSGSNIESNVIQNEIKRHRRHSKSKESSNLSKTDVKKQEDSSVKKIQARKQDDSSSVQVRLAQRTSKAREIPQPRTVSVSPNKCSHVRHSMTLENQRLAKTTEVPHQRIVSITPSGGSGQIGQTPEHSKAEDVPQMRMISVTTNEGSKVSHSSKVESRRHYKADVVSVTPSEGSHARQCTLAVNQRESKAEEGTQSRIIFITPTDVSSGQSQTKAEVASQVRIVSVTPSAGSGGQVRQSQTLGKAAEAPQTGVVSVFQKEDSRVRPSLREENPRQPKVEEKIQPKKFSVTPSEVSGGFLRQTQRAENQGQSKSKEVPQPRIVSVIPGDGSQARLPRKAENQTKTVNISNARTDSDDGSQVCQSLKEEMTQSEAKDVPQIRIVSVTPGDQKQSKTREVPRSRTVSADPTPKIVSPITKGGDQARRPRTVTVPQSDCSQDTPQPRTVPVSPNKGRQLRKPIAVSNQNRSKAKKAAPATIITSLLCHSPSEESQDPPKTKVEAQLRIVSIPPRDDSQVRPLRRTEDVLPPRTVAVPPSDGNQVCQEQQNQSKMKVASLPSPVAVVVTPRKDAYLRSTDRSSKKRRRHSRTRGSQDRSHHRHSKSPDSKHSSSRRSDSTRASKSDRSRSKTSKSSKRRSHGDGARTSHGDRARTSHGDRDGGRRSHGNRDKIKVPEVPESTMKVVRRPMGPLDLEADYGYVLIVKGDRISLPDWVYL